MRPIKRDNCEIHYLGDSIDHVRVENGTGRIGFYYDCDMEVSCSFDLLSEVCQSKQQGFKDLLAKKGWELDTAETETDFFNVVKYWGTTVEFI